MTEHAEAVEMFPESESQWPVDAQREYVWDVNAKSETLAILVHEDGPPDDLAEQAKALDLVREARRRLSDVERVLENAVADSMQGKTEEVHEVGVLEKRGGKKRKSWDHEGVASRVVSEIRVDKETGEVRDPSPQEVANALVEAAGINYWKVSSLRDLGIEPSEYCEESPGRVTVQILKAGD